ncbi:MAG: hypothetical protein Q4F41_10415 [Eubacteriales bacterium]|nr:hypothetical protein [Eubacteriales bacterium]
MNRKHGIWGMLGLFVFLLCITTPASRAWAASDFNLIQAVDKKAIREGTWKKDEVGYWYQYTNGKYPRKVWLKINGKYYYFDAQGYLKTGWFTFKGNRYYLSKRKGREGELLLGFQSINGKKYHFSKKTALMSYGWNKISGKWYHFDETTGVMDKNCWIDGRYLQSNGVMAVSCWVDGKYVGADGYEVEDAVAQSKLIFVGDSRTVGMKAAVGGKAVYIAKIGEGYDWLSTTALKSLKKQLAKYPASQVVFNLGVNDVGNVSAYRTFYRKLFAQYPDAKFYILSVNPIENGKGSWAVTNKMIRAFNKKMKAAFPENYLDCYSELVKNGYETADGLHYTSTTYWKIYDFVLNAIS